MLTNFAKRLAVFAAKPTMVTRVAPVAIRTFSAVADGKEQGTVKWFDASKGYGFITREGGSDIFVHFSSIVADGYRSLEEGQRVEFAISQSHKGPSATEVKVVTN